MWKRAAAAAVLWPVLALGACASAPKSGSEEFSPPLTVGMAREYANGLQEVQNAVRVAASAGPRELTSEQVVDGSALIVWTAFRQGINGATVGRGRARVVVQSLTPDRTVVRVFWPEAATFAGGTSGTEEIFRAIEGCLR